MKRLSLLLILFSLGGCVTPGVEMPENNGDASDTMRKSPCACVDLDHDRGFTWVS